VRTLDVYLHGDLTGRLILRNNGRMTFEYVERWLDGTQAVPLSHSLPLQAKPFSQGECEPFFGGLLPEADNRRLIARLFHISERNDFALLERIGDECAGAVVLRPAEETDAQDERLLPLSEEDLAAALAELPRRPLLVGTDGLRLSLAGAQDKLAVRLEGDDFFLPLGAAASTHIVKPAIAGYEGLVFNEAFCLLLAAASGLLTAQCRVGNAGDIDYLLVERFDRARTQEGHVKRIHQEDFCQALGVRTDRKYQADGGPSLEQCFALLRQASSAPVLDLTALLNAVTFNLIIGNHDAHGKNFALLREPGQVRLAPLYDLVCTAVFPNLSARMAMRIGRQTDSMRVSTAELERMARDAGLARPLAIQRVRELVAVIRGQIASVAAQDPRFAPTATHVAQRAEYFAKSLGA